MAQCGSTQYEGKVPLFSLQNLTHTLLADEFVYC